MPQHKIAVLLVSSRRADDEGSQRVTVAKYIVIGCASNLAGYPHLLGYYEYEKVGWCESNRALLPRRVVRDIAAVNHHRRYHVDPWVSWAIGRA